jgi:hypothetical protein
MTGSTKTIVCFARPTHEYFTAAFFVAEVQPEECMEHSPNTTCEQLPVKLKDCLAGSWTWRPPESTTRGQSARIGSVRAKVFRISDSWAGGGQSGEIYRVFHSGKCYELGINEGGATSTPFDPEDCLCRLCAGQVFPNSFFTVMASIRIRGPAPLCLFHVVAFA